MVSGARALERIVTARAARRILFLDTFRHAAVRASSVVRGWHPSKRRRRFLFMMEDGNICTSGSCGYVCRYMKRKGEDAKRDGHLHHFRQFKIDRKFNRLKSFIYGHNIDEEATP